MRSLSSIVWKEYSSVASMSSQLNLVTISCRWSPCQTVTVWQNHTARLALAHGLQFDDPGLPPQSRMQGGSWGWQIAVEGAVGGHRLLQTAKQNLQGVHNLLHLRLSFLQRSRQHHTPLGVGGPGRISSTPECTSLATSPEAPAVPLPWVLVETACGILSPLRWPSFSMGTVWWVL